MKGFKCFNLRPKHKLLVDPKQTVPGKVANSRYFSDIPRLILGRLIRQCPPTLTAIAPCRALSFLRCPSHLSTRSRRHSRSWGNRPDTKPKRYILGLQKGPENVPYIKKIVSFSTMQIPFVSRPTTTKSKFDGVVLDEMPVFVILTCFFPC